jgi:anti-sigma B factor antagonist
VSELQVEHAGDVVIARPTEDIDTANARAVQRTLAACLDRDADHLILDLSAVRYLDSAGLDMLLRLSELLRHRRSELLVVIPGSSPLTRVAEIVDLPSIVPVHPTLADALAAYGQRRASS